MANFLNDQKPLLFQPTVGTWMSKFIYKTKNRGEESQFYCGFLTTQALTWDLAVADQRL